VHPQRAREQISDETNDSAGDDEPQKKKARRGGLHPRVLRRLDSKMLQNKIGRSFALIRIYRIDLAKGRASLYLSSSSTLCVSLSLVFGPLAVTDSCRVSLSQVQAPHRPAPQPQDHFSSFVRHCLWIWTVGRLDLAGFKPAWSRFAGLFSEPDFVHTVP
jgi:hypothetical protein